MKIRIEEQSGLAETEIIIQCSRTDEQVLKMLAVLRVFDRKLTGTRNGQTLSLIHI